jgi:hypothetical protein
VIDYYSGVEGYKSEAMEQGIRVHAEIAQKRMKLIKGIKRPRYEYRFEFDDDGDVVSGYIDVLCSDMIIDWKISTRDAKQHDMKQLQFYNWCIQKCGMKSRKYGMIVQVSPDLEVLSKSACELGLDMTDWYLERKSRIVEILKKNNLI